VKRWRRPPLQHPLAPAFASAVESLCTALTASSARNYNIVVRHFLVYLTVEHPEATRIEQLRRDPHILGWMACLRAQAPPLAATPASADSSLSAPSSTSWPGRTNCLNSLTCCGARRTGMRIGECADLSFDCLRSAGPDQWAIHVPLGKLKTERMIPGDAFVRDLVHRLRFFRSLDPLPADERLIARPGSKVAIVVQLRDYLHQICYSLGLSTRIVPHHFDTPTPRKCFAPV
jgi:hypothetical protein